MARDLDLAVVMIVKNEEKNIANMFNSFRDNGLNPDFYITDTGSTDNTVKICKAYGAKVFFDTHVERFDESRNRAFARVDKNYKWLMTIDGDEFIDERIADGIKRILNSANAYTDYDAFWVHSDHLKQMCRDSKLMIVKHSLVRSGAIKYQYWIHEQIDKSNLDPERIGHIIGALKHHNERREGSYDEFLKTYQFYTEIANEFKKEYPNNWYAHWMTYQEYSYRVEWLHENIAKADYKKYIQDYSKALELGFNDDNVEIRHFTKCLDVFYDTLEVKENWKMFFRTRESFEKYIEEICGRMIIKCGLHPWIMRTLGQLYLYSKKYKKSIYWNNQLLESNPKLELYFDFNDLNYVGDYHTLFEPFVRNVEAYMSLGDMSNARRCYEQIAYLAPEEPIVKEYKKVFEHS